MYTNYYLSYAMVGICVLIKKIIFNVLFCESENNISQFVGWDSYVLGKLMRKSKYNLFEVTIVYRLNR